MDSRKRDEEELSPDAAAYLNAIRESGAVRVWAYNLLAAAELLSANLVNVEDDEDGPWIHLR